MITFFRLLALSILLFAGNSAAAFAQTYPDRPITLVVPFAAGSGTDAVARVIAEKLSERLGQPIVIENRPGANGQIGVEHASKANPDGYTLLMATATSHSANPGLYKSLRYDPLRDFTAIARTGILPFVITVKPSLPVQNVKELIQYARSRPGQVTFASPNSTSMLAGAALGKIADVELISVPYKAAPQALADILAGHTDMYVVDFAVGLPSIRSEKLRAIAITSAQRSPLMRNVPPLADTLQGFDLTPWNGIFAPANLPKQIADKLAAELLVVLNDKTIRERCATIGFDVSPTRSPEEFQKYVAEQLVHWSDMIKIARVQPE